MSTQVSDLVQRIEPSGTIAVDTRARQLRQAGRRILGLGGGQPDFATPAPICEAAIAAIRAGAGHYTAVEGTAELRRAIVDKLERDNRLRVSTDQIVVSNGAKHTLFNALMATVNPGAGVVIPAPYWVSYTEMVRLAGGDPQVVTGDPQAALKLTPDILESAITDSTRVLILNSPCNPTGAVYARSELEGLAEVVRRHDLLVITDEIYEKIVYEGAEHLSFLEVAPDRAASTVVVNGVSKAFAMTGWRIGYAAAPVEIARAMTKLQGQSTGNPSAVSQAAATAALSLGDTVVEPMIAAYRERRAAMVEGLRSIRGIEIDPPDGTFYAFARVSDLMAAVGCATSLELGERLLDGPGVAAVPGSAFGAEGAMRFSFAADRQVIVEALARVAEFARAGAGADG